MSSATLTMRAPHEAVVITPRVGSCSVRRYYDPSTGQFISVDPLVDQTGQAYAYVNGDPVNSTDPLGLGCFLDIACGVQSAVANTLNPWSTSNPIRQWAASGSWTAGVLYANPAYYAVSGYANEAQAYENGCSLWTVAKYGAEGAAGVVATGLTATGAVAFAGFLDNPDIEWSIGSRGFHLHYDNVPHGSIGPHWQLDTWLKGVEDSGRQWRFEWPRG